MRPVLFLDFDGVVVPVRQYEKRPFAQPWAPADTQCILRLNRILAPANWRVVVCSSWRFAFNMRDVFRNMGIHGGPEGTTTLSIQNNRGAEITQYIDEHKPDRFVILDDDHVGMAPLAKWHVKPDQYVGLEDRHVEEALEILRRQESWFARTAIRK